MSLVVVVALVAGGWGGFSGPICFGKGGGPPMLKSAN
jgi:hypothetical protein